MHNCLAPCGSIDCAHGCISGKPWTGSPADSPQPIKMVSPTDLRKELEVARAFALLRREGYRV
jgi:hypothetical protein